MATSEVRRTRDADRSRTAILDAAEGLFAAQGYKGTSLQDVGDAAGVSRGTPSYFFGSKEGLYRAVLERKFSRIGEVIRQTRAEATSRGEGPDAVIAREIEAYLDFLVEHPTFVRLVQWEAVEGGETLNEMGAYAAAPLHALDAIRGEVERDSLRPIDPMQLMVSIAALCWFPLSQRDTLMRALGVDPVDPAFVEARKRHVVDLVLNGIRRR